jgi:hypothetical protein
MHVRFFLSTQPKCGTGTGRGMWASIGGDADTYWTDRFRRAGCSQSNGSNMAGFGICSYSQFESTWFCLDLQVLGCHRQGGSLHTVVSSWFYQHEELAG